MSYAGNSGGLVLEVKGSELIKHFSALTEARAKEAEALASSKVQLSTASDRIDELKRDTKRYAFYASHLREEATYLLRPTDLDTLELWGPGRW